MPPESKSSVSSLLETPEVSQRSLYKSLEMLTKHFESEAIEAAAMGMKDTSETFRSLHTKPCRMYGTDVGPSQALVIVKKRSAISLTETVLRYLHILPYREYR